MDKNSLIGFGLIAIVLVAFFQFNQPNSKTIEAQRRYQDSIIEILDKQEAEFKDSQSADSKNRVIQLLDSTSLFFNINQGHEKFITLANKKLTMRLSTLGGRICSATLTNYKNQEGGTVTLFSEKDSLAVGNVRRSNDFIKNGLYFTFDGKNENINTRDLYFTPMHITDSSVVMRLEFASDKYIDFSYRLLPESYMVNLSVDAHNMENIFPGNMHFMGITWDQILRQQEKGFTFEQRYTTLTYKLKNEGTDYLSETSNTKKSLSEPVDWVAFKNQFFSSILIANDDFSDVKLSSDTLKEGKGYLKNCSAQMYAPFDPSGKISSDFQFYFGPNKFSTLKHSNTLASNGDKDLQLHKLIYFGWPIIRWINRYFIMYLFDWLTSFGLSMGVVLLLLTLIVKAVVYPFTYKSFVSSAKMRALKPYIDTINAKYTKSEDAMKKQQEIMGLYSRYGASPMGGCLPMLIQMPIFIALFNFVPNAIELRQQSFLWASDLSTYDDLISWTTPIWPLGNHISLFCLLFCITQILNTYYTQKMQPNLGGSSEQAQQMKMMRWMMYLMPIVFFFIFNDYSSGLNYYYFLSTLFSVFIFIYLQRVVDEKELLRKMEAYHESNKNNPKKQSNMMARLEALQKEQEKKVDQQKKNRK